MFSGDETGLFWRRMLMRTDFSKEEQIAASDQMMVLLGGKADRYYKLKPLVVCLPENP
jgi:hypothetical protein